MSNLSSDQHPGGAILTIRVIKSFPYRNAKNLLVHGVDLQDVTVGAFKAQVIHEIATKAGWKAYQGLKLDTLKLYTQPQGTKTMNLIVNLDDDEKYIMADEGKSLASYDCRNETEISFFNMEGYLDFKANPEQKW